MPRLIPATLLLILLAAPPAAAQRGEVYCNVTEITSEQLSNGVRVTIKADGELKWYVDWRQLIEEGAAEGEFGEHWLSVRGFTEKFRRLPIHIWNARSKLGTGFVAIGKYPISHAEIYIPEWADEGIGLEVDRVNYLGWITGEGELERRRGNFDWASSEDSSEIIVLWQSDRFPPPQPPTTPKDLPAELEVAADEGLFSIRAVNAELQEVVNAIAREGGFTAIAPSGDDLRVSVCLESIAPEKALEAVALGCGLFARAWPDGSWVVAKPGETAPGYAASESRRLYLRHLRAVDAMDLLPNFLLEYVRPDEGRNAVVVSGPQPLLDRVAEDLRKLDVPAPEIEVEAVAVEYTSAEAIARALHLERFVGDFAGGLDSLTGGLRLLWLDGLPDGWDLLLDNLEGQTSTRLSSRARGRVLNGHLASLAAGEERFVVLERLYDPSLAELVAIPTSTLLVLQPLVGDGDEVMLRITLVVRTISGTDPQSGMPIVAIRRAATQLRVRDGETVDLAGIRTEQTERRDRSIPILGRLPLLGQLFRSSERSRSETQLAFFVTPHIVRARLAQEGEPTHG